MKTITTISGLFFLSFILSCGDGKKSNAVDNNGENMEQNAPRNTVAGYDQSGDVQERINAIDSMHNEAQHNGTDTEGASGSVNPADNNRMNKMFADLNFTDDQIKEYNTTLTTDLEEWRTNNDSADISSEVYQRMEDKSMKAMLSPAQYEQYQQWVKDNPIDNQR